MLTLLFALLGMFFVSGYCEVEGVLRGRAVHVVMLTASAFGRAWTIKLTPYRHNRTYYRITARAW